MKNLILALMFVYSGAVLAADNPEWAYPVTPPLESKDNVIMKSLPGSTKQYTQAQIDDPFNPPDWFPDEHPPLPSVVASGGTRPRVACGLCHLPSGNGHPESASLAGLDANYMIRQMQAFKDGDRKGVRAAPMNANSKLLSDEEIRSSVNYFAALFATSLTATGTISR